MHDTPTRLTLLQRVRDPSDGAAWAEFVALYEPLLRGYARKKRVPDHDADDVVQGILVSLLQSLPTLELDPSRGRFRSWLWQVTANAIADWGRRLGRLPRTGVEGGLERGYTDPGPDGEWLAEHRRRVLEFALERVKAATAAKTWACFEQHLLQHRPGQEVGAGLGLPANTVYVHAARVLRRVRERVKEYMEDLE